MTLSDRVPVMIDGVSVETSRERAADAGLTPMTVPTKLRALAVLAERGVDILWRLDVLRCEIAAAKARDDLSIVDEILRLRKVS